MIVSADSGQKMDYTYGVKHDGGRWMIGDSQVEIDGNDNFVINGLQLQRHAGTFRTGVHETSG